MPISYKHKKIFIHIPKNAGTSVTKSLGLKFEGHHKHFFYKKILDKHYDKFSVFCVIRNPIDRFISNYNYSRMDKSYHHSINEPSKHGKHPDFEICKNHTIKDVVRILKEEPHKLKHDGWKPQSYWLEGFDINNIDFVLYEDLSDYMLNNFNVKLEEINKSERSCENLDEESINILIEIYSDDIKLIERIKL